MKKFRIKARFVAVEQTDVIEAMDATEAIDKWGIENNFKYEYILSVIEVL